MARVLPHAAPLAPTAPLPARPLVLRLADGRRATLALTPQATVLAVDDVYVSSWDLCGRPYALVRDGLTYRRALDGRLLCKGRDAAGARVRHCLPPGEGETVLAAARDEAGAAADALSRGTVSLDGAEREEALRRLGAVAALDAAALRADVRRFAATYSPVGILPPDQYLALVVQATEGCSWNTCSFCDFYRGVPFRVRTPAEFAAHVAAVKACFGPALSLRRSLFLGAANALCVGHERLLALLDELGRAFELAPPDLPAGALGGFLRERPAAMSGVAAFVDAWTGQRKTAAEYRAYAERGLRRVYVGLESGDAGLLAYLDKAGTPEDAVELVTALHDAGVGVGVIVLVGAGGEPYFARHVERTAAVLRAMRLGPRDLLYFSELVAPPGVPHAPGRPPAGDVALDAVRRRAQREAVVAGLARGSAGPRVAVYDIREFIY